ncbi:7 transmembrane receptor [Dictyocaulus viviparus]|uniref:7 transmembrane receptor n=1 Tax=Dictyocaulus viviparus TaxID=29172 RepID=A0A0D8Y662_DICVI|nr:7 transmembrane receptor [Dictyocaulus viviparus]
MYHVDNVIEGEGGLYKNNVKEIHHRICKQKEAHRTRRQISNSTLTSDLWSNLFEQWLRDTDELVDHDDEDPPAFDASEIGATRCLDVEEVDNVQRFYQNITCTPQPDALNPCENIVGLWMLRKAIWPVCTLAIVGNVFVWVILGLAFEKRMRVHYLFMINLAIADLITGVYLAVLAVQDVRTGDEYYRHAVSWQTGWGCSMAGFFAVLSSELSIISMFFIAFEMAYNTRNAFYGQRLRFPVACMMMVGGWVFALMMATLPLMDLSSYSTASICLPLRLHNIADRAYIIFFLLFNLFAFLAMVVCYVFLMLMLKNPKTPSRDEDNLIINKMVWLVGVDFLCWFPTLFFGLSAALGHPMISLSSAKFLLVFFFPINASANPFLYVFFTKIIQRNVKTKAMPMIRRITNTSGVALNTLSNFYHSQPPCKREEILQRNVKTKAMPMIRRITNTSGVALNTLSNFYHSQPPCKREEVSSPSRLGVSQMTSLTSIPRGSNCSSPPAAIDTDITENQNRPSPRVSFQDDNSPHSSTDTTRLSFGWSKRISSIPEVSDLSEHSSESHHEHIPKGKKLDVLEVPPRFGSYRFGFGRHRHSSVGLDSGRGSLASVSTRDTVERNSLASRDGGVTDAEGDVTSKLILLPSTSEPPLIGLRRSSWMPQLLDRQRTEEAHQFNLN